MMSLSIVSHRQGTLVAGLLADVARIDSPLVTSILITRNVDEAPIAVPASLASITTVLDNAAQRGFGANHNAAFDHCRTPLFVVLNPDLRLPDDPFGAIAGRLADADRYGRIALVSPRIVTPDGRPEDAARELITPWRIVAHRLLRRRREPATDFDWLAGMFMAIRSDAFRAMRGFDERYYLYCEDFDLCARLRLAGWRIEVADAVSVVHAARRDSHRSMRHLLWHVKSLMRMWTSSAFWSYRRSLLRSAR